jgi:hypothetical protein
MCANNQLLSDLKEAFSDSKRPGFFCDVRHQESYYAHELNDYISSFEYGELDVEGLKQFQADISALSPDAFKYVFLDLLGYAFKYACEKREADWYADLIIMKVESDLDSINSTIRTKFTRSQLRASAHVIAAIVECEKKIEKPGIFSFAPSLRSFWFDWV